MSILWNFIAEFVIVFAFLLYYIDIFDKLIKGIFYETKRQFIFSLLPFSLIVHFIITSFKQLR